MLKLGCAQADITPDLPLTMGGSFLKFPSEEVLDPIMASCVVVDDATTRLACALGGYEAIQARFNPDAGERIQETSITLLKQLIATPPC